MTNASTLTGPATRTASIHMNVPVSVVTFRSATARRLGNQIAFGYSYDEGETLDPLIVVHCYSDGSIRLDEEWVKAEHRKEDHKRELAKLLKAIGVSVVIYHAILWDAYRKEFSDVGAIAGYIEAVALGHVKARGIGKVYRQQLKEALLRYHEERMSRAASGEEAFSARSA